MPFPASESVPGKVADADPAPGVTEADGGRSSEVRRLLDAGLVAIRRNGTKSSPRVAEVVAEAGLFNDAFYRHFRSKDELVTAILEEGTALVQRHLARKMAEADDPAEQISIMVTTLLRRAADPEVAEMIRALLWNATRVADDTSRRLAARELLSLPLVPPIARLGSDDPERDARVVCDAALARQEDFLWRREAPTQADYDHLVRFCLQAVQGSTT